MSSIHSKLRVSCGGINLRRKLKFSGLVLVLNSAFFVLPAEAAKVEQNHDSYDYLNPSLDFDAFLEPGPAGSLVPDEQDVQENQEQIRQNLKEKNYDLALTQSLELLEQQPENFSVVNLVALSYLGQNNNREAEKYFQDVLTLSPGNPIASGGLAAIAIDQGDNEAARSYYEQALKVSPNNLGIIFHLVKLEYREGHLDKCEDLLTNAIHKSPAIFAPRLLLATLFLQSGQPTRAKELLQEAQGQFSDEPRLASLLGDVQMELRLYDKAIANYQRLESIQPGSASVHFKLAMAYAKTNNKEKLSKELQQVLKIKPAHRRASILLVRLAMLDKKPQKAIALLEELKKTYPNEPAVLAQEGWLAEQLNKPNKAITAYKAALKLTPDSSQLTSRLATAQVNSGDENSGIETLGQWLNKHPEDLRIRLLRARLYHFHEKPTQAIADYEIYIEKEPNDVSVLNSLGWLLRQFDTKKAIKYTKRALKLAPDNPAVLDTMGMLMLDLNKTEQALKLINKAAKLVPDESAIVYHLALVKSRNGQKLSAQTILKNLLKTDTKFAERKEAETLLENLNQ